MTGEARTLGELSDALHAEDIGETPAETLRVLTFELAGQLVGVPLGVAQSIVRIPELTPVPGAPLNVLGVANVRGRIVVVLDMKLALGWGRTRIGEHARMLVVDVNDRSIALVAEAVRSIGTLIVADIAPAPDELAAMGARLVQGLGTLQQEGKEDQRILLLAADALVTLQPRTSPREDA